MSVRKRKEVIKMTVFALVMIIVACLVLGFSLGRSSVNVRNKDNELAERSVQEFEYNVKDIGDTQEVEIETILNRINEEDFGINLDLLKGIIRALAIRDMPLHELGATLNISIQKASALCRILSQHNYITRTETVIKGKGSVYYYSLFPSLVAK